MQRNDTLVHATTCMHLTDTALGKISQVKKYTVYDSIYIKFKKQAKNALCLSRQASVAKLYRKARQLLRC